MRVALFEDRPACLEPLSLTRPTFDLRCGARSLREKQLETAGAKEWGMWVRPWLADVCRRLHPGHPVNAVAWMREQPILLVNGRWLPQPGTAIAPQPGAGVIDDQIAYAVVAPDRWERVGACGDGADAERCVEELVDALPIRTAPGKMIDAPWDLVDANAAELERDFALLRKKPARRLMDTTILGAYDAVWTAPTAEIEPMVLIDARRGPVAIDADAVVSAFARLEGPCYVGPGTHVLAASLRGGVSLGPRCRIGGEVEASIVHGFSNKCHEGFLGHSYVGEWVNLGAGTHNSDLRNDYGEVSVVLAGRSIRTGRKKVGCFLGDHVKTGLGTLLNTGTTVGAFSNVLPAGRFAPKYMPPFSNWWNGALREGFPLDQLLATARIAMGRRGQELTSEHETLYRGLEARTAAERVRALRDSEQRLLRRSA